MKLATLADGTRDGRLVIVSRDNARYVPALGIARTLQAALDDWDTTEPKLRALADELQRGDVAGEPVNPERLLSPLPRAYEWVDGSAFLQPRPPGAQGAQGAEPPPTLETRSPGLPGRLAATCWRRPRTSRSPTRAWGLRLRVRGLRWSWATCPRARAPPTRPVRSPDPDLQRRDPAQPDPRRARQGLRLLQRQAGSTAFAPFALTPDELGAAWRDGRVHLPLCTWLNGELAGDPEAGDEMHFSFYDLMQHVRRRAATPPAPSSARARVATSTASAAAPACRRSA